MNDTHTYDEFLRLIQCRIDECPENKDEIIADAMRCSGCPYLQRMIEREIDHSLVKS